MGLCRAGRYDEAARFLLMSPERRASEGAVLARHLKAVLDRHVWVDLDLISTLPTGNPDDRLPPEVEEIGKITNATGMTDSVRLVRRETPEGPRWMFSWRTVRRIEGWYHELKDRWFLENLPPALLRPGPKDLLWWQWIALPLLFVAAWSVGYVCGWVTNFLLSRLVARTKIAWDDILVERLQRPIRAGWGLAAVFAVIPWLSLYDPAETFLRRWLRVLALLIVFWALLRIVDLLGDLVLHWGVRKETHGIAAVVPVATSIVKVFVLGLGLVAVLSEFGYPATSLIAGLGVGGIALALAAQKTVENLFGSVSIGVDKPFRVGDFVKIEDFVGTVELVGLRSTRIRTLDRTLITIPNGKLADMRVESYAPRDRIRLALKLGLVYETTAAQMREVLDGVEKVLRDHPKIWPDSITVRFEALGDSALVIDVMAWFQTPEWSEFQAIRQDVLLRFMEVVERAGTGFAFPTRTVHLVQDNPPPAANTRAEPPRELTA